MDINFFQADKKKKLSLEISEGQVTFNIWKKEEITLSDSECEKLLNFLGSEILKAKSDLSTKTTEDLAGEIAKDLLGKNLGGFIYGGKKKR